MLLSSPPLGGGAVPPSVIEETTNSIDVRRGTYGTVKLSGASPSSPPMGGAALGRAAVPYFFGGAVCSSCVALRSPPSLLKIVISGAK